MSDSISPVILTNILEESGTLGGIAALVLAAFLEPHPPAVSAVPNGFVYSKSYPFLADKPTEIPLTSFLKLRSTGAAFTISLGVHKEKDSFRYINLIITLTGQDGIPGMELVFGNGVMKKADVVKSPEGNVIGYKNAEQELTIPFPVASLEFCFEVTEEPEDQPAEVDQDGLPFIVHVPEIVADDPNASSASPEEESELHPTGFVGSLKFHQIGGTVANAILDGIIELDFGSVIVLPWLGDTGIYIDKLLLDWSDENIGNFAQSFPQIYGPQWKGFAATHLSVIVPLNHKDQATPDFLVFDAANFLWDTEGKISVKASIDYQNNEEDAVIHNIHGGLEIYENDPVRSSASIWFNLDKCFNKVADDGVNNASASGSKIDVSQAKTTINQQAKNPKKHLLGCDVKLVHFFSDEKDYFMFEFSFLGIREKTGVNVSPNLFFDPAHLYFNSAVFLGVGSWMLYKGIVDEKASLHTFGGSALITLSVLEFLYPNNGPDMIDILKEFRINKLGFRTASFTHNGEKKKVFNLLLDLEASVTFDKLVLAKVIEGLLTLFGMADPGPVELFGETLDKVSINGKLTVQFKNILISFGKNTIPEALNSIFGIKPLSITATDIPTIAIEEDANDNKERKNFDIHTETRFVTKNINNETHFGLTFGITGVTVAGVSAMAAIKGFSLFIYPKFEFVLDFEFKLPTEIVVFYPGAFLAKGQLEINKPLPASDATLNLIYVEVGLLALPELSNLDPRNYDKYLDIHSYKYRGMGTIAFGDATIRNADQSVVDNYSFWYTSFYLQFGTPIPFPTPVAGVSGFGGLFGLNVSPGSIGDGAHGISNWIKQSDDFYDVLRWEDGNTESSWHPNKSFDSSEQEFSNIYNIGLVLAMADVPTRGATMRGQGLLLIEISFDPGFLRSFSLGARIELPKIGLSALVLLVVDPHGFVLTIDFSLRVKKDSGRIYKVRFPIEFGFYKKQAWTFVGHYLDSKGGPATADILDSLFQASFYVVYSTETLESFGLNPFNSENRIKLPGPAIGYGLLYKLGPKQYGPSYLHLKLFAALGVNFGLHTHEEVDGRSELMAFGEGFAGGAVTLKVFIVKFEISLLAIVNFLINNEGYRIFGELVLRLSMPWPFDDIKAGIDFIIQSDGFLPIPPVSIDSALTGQAKLVKKTFDPSAVEPPQLFQIDSALVLKFSRKVNNEIIPNPALIPDGLGISVLSINDLNGLDGTVYEKIQTEYQGLKYVLHFNHQIENLRISTLNGNTREIVHGKFASWGTPSLDENNVPEQTDEPTKTLYIGTLFPNDEQFNAERMGKFHAWNVQNQRKSPCEIYNPVCISSIPQIDAPANNNVQILEDWSVIKFRSIPHVLNPYVNSFVNEQVLATRPGPENRHQFLLPYYTIIDVTQSKMATIQLEFEFIPNNEIKAEKPNLTGNSKYIERIDKLYFDNPTRLLLDVFDYFEIQVTANLVDGTTIAGQVKLFPNDINLVEPTTFRAEFIPFVNAEENVNNINFRVVRSEDNRLGFEIDFLAFQQAYQVNKLTVNGWRSVLKLDRNPTPLELEVIRQTLKDCKLYCNELCLFKKDLNEKWFDPTNFSDDNLDELEANSTELIDAVEGALLFKPNKRYQIDYTVRTHVKVFHQKDNDYGDTDEELVTEKELITTTYTGGYPAGGTTISENDINIIPPLHFDTEASPSQEIEPYIGFHFPAPASKLLYPEQTSPTLALKYLSLIRRIFSIHENDNHEDVLTPRLILTETGEEIQFDLQAVRIVNSSAMDQFTEAALDCAQSLDQMNYMDLYVLSRALETNRNYALQLYYSGQNASITRVQYNSPFTTSNFMNLLEHGAHFNELINSAVQEPLADSANSIAAAQNLIDAALLKFENGNDVLVEKIYQQSLGILESRYFESGEDGALWMVSIVNGETQFWGVIVEMSEAIFNKAGVSINDLSNRSKMEAGIKITNSNVMIITDLSGSRAIIFRVNENNVILPFGDVNATVGLSSTNKQIWETMVTEYVNSNYAVFPQNEKDSKVAEIIGVLENTADANKNVAISNVNLSIHQPNNP